MASSPGNQRAWSSTSEVISEARCLVAMDAESTAVTPGQRSTMASSSRKRGSWSTTSEDTELYSVTGDDSSDDSFESVMSRKAKRRFLKVSSPARTLTMKTKIERWPHSILFVPEDSSISLRTLNRQALSMFLEGVAPNEIREVRINTRKNILAVDATNCSALDKLRKITDLGGIKVRPRVPLDESSMAGVIYDIDLAIANSDLPILIKPVTEGVIITHVLRLGNSRCVKLIFKGDSIPSHVKVGHFRHAVRPFVPKPLQCHNCMKIGHVKGVCTKSTVCPRCAESHTVDACRATHLKCSNCDGSHDASSKECPQIRREIAVLKQMVRDSSSHREAAETVRRRRNRRRKRTRRGADHTQNVPNPLPSSASKHTSTKRIETEKSKAAEDWPALPRTQPAKEPPRLMSTSTHTSVDEVPRVDRQIIPMLRSLMNVIKELLTSIATPAARSGLQVLDALSPVLAALE